MGTPPTPALRTRGLTKYYGRQTGVLDLDLDVRPGEIFGFLGPNGSGKTTTIRLLLGLLRPTRGVAEVMGRSVASAGVAARSLTGYLPGDLATYERMRGRQFLAYLAELRGGVPAGRYEELAERFRVDLSRRLRELSKGNRQKVGVIQAFMHRPPLLVLDEPTSGLDPLVQEEFAQLVRETVSQGSTVFLSSHILSEVEDLADRVGILDEGRLLLVDSVDGLRERAPRRIEMDFPATPPEAIGHADGVVSCRTRGATAYCLVRGGIGPLLKTAVDHGVVNLHTHDPDLEDVFREYTTGARR